MSVFYKFEGSTEYIPYEEDGLIVNIPPVGKVWDFLTGRLVETGVYARSESATAQYWTRDIFDGYDFDRAKEKEEKKQKSNPLYVDPELERFIEREWFRRVNGFWFYNNGVPTYLTGTNYFYLMWWYLDGRYPDFRSADKDFFYIWDYAKEDPNSFGVVEAARRRAGKTARATCAIFDRISYKPQANAGIQSKTGKDAQVVFSKLINSFRSLPFFFKPVYDTSSGTRPKSVLSFMYKSSQKDVGKDEELRGQIDYGSMENLFYDGQRLVGYIRDECGKTDGVDIHEGWSILRPCLIEGTKDIIGKAIYTTTIEEGGSAPFKLLWNDSNPKEIDEKTKRTRSGMYRFFTPAYKNDASFIDRYGVCDEVASKQALMDEREALAGDPKALASFKRKFPFDINEAFFSINDMSIYDSIKLNMQLEILSFKPEKEWFVRGNLKWENGIGSKVFFEPNFNGRWNIHRKYLEQCESNPHINNKFTVEGTKYKLRAGFAGVTSADTFDHSLKNISDRNQASNASFYTLIRSDVSLPEELNDTFVIEYVYRQPSADLMAEDLLRQCVFTSTPAVVENNKPAAIHYFERHGYGSWIVKVDNRQGISANNKNKQQMAETTESYINENCEKVVFPRLLLSWNDFSLENSTAFDEAMAAGWGLLIATRLDKRFMEKPSHLRQVAKRSSASWISRNL